MTQYIILIILLLPLIGFAQEDNYIVTIQNDTLSGKVVRNNLNTNWLTLENADGKRKIHLREIKVWKNGNMPVMVIPQTTGKRDYWMELLMEVKGRKKLYRDLSHLTGKNIYYTEHKENYIQLTNKIIESKVWQELSECEAFSKKYSRWSGKQSELKRIFQYYNQYCP